MKEKDTKIEVAGVLEAASNDERGTFVKLRLKQDDAVRLMAAGAFNRIVQVRFEP